MLPPGNENQLMNGFNLDLIQSNCWQLTGKSPCFPRRHKQRVFIQLGSSIPLESCQILIYPLIFPGIAVESILCDLSLPPWTLCMLAGQWEVVETQSWRIQLPSEPWGCSMAGRRLDYCTSTLSNQHLLCLAPHRRAKRFASSQHLREGNQKIHQRIKKIHWEDWE